MALQERGPAAGSDAAPDPAPATHDTTPGPARTGPAPAGWRRARAVIAWTDRPAVPGLITLLAAAGFVLARWDLWARRSISRFILIGQIFAHPAQLPAGMPLRAQYGYADLRSFVEVYLMAVIVLLSLPAPAAAQARGLAAARGHGRPAAGA